MLNNSEIASRLQYTNIQANATRDQIVAHCTVGADCSFHAVMLQPCWVPLARDMLRGTGVRVASAIAYPLGGETTAMKVGLARELAKIGVDEFDFQPNIGFLLSGMESDFVNEIRAVVEAADGRSVKCMSEFGFLTDQQKIRCLRLAEEGGVSYVKNSSGVGPGGSPASPEVIRFMRRHISDATRIKASGQIRTREQVVSLIEAGADLVGTSAAPAIVRVSVCVNYGY
jgi:deoxyribose-phosphate aldolase